MLLVNQKSQNINKTLEQFQSGIEVQVAAVIVSLTTPDNL